MGDRGLRSERGMRFVGLVAMSDSVSDRNVTEKITRSGNRRDFK